MAVNILTVPQALDAHLIEVTATLTPNLLVNTTWEMNFAGAVTVNDATGLESTNQVLSGSIYFTSTVTTKAFGTAWKFMGNLPTTGEGVVMFTTTPLSVTPRRIIASWIGGA